jgi:hypothetical protein
MALLGLERVFTVAAFDSSLQDAGTGVAFDVIDDQATDVRRLA